MRPARFAPALAVLTVLVVACGGSERVSGSGAAGIVADISSTPDTREPEPSTVGAGLARGSAAPEFSSIESWINSEPLTMAGLLEEGHVILVDFWTYTCINCIRTLPYLKAWDEGYRDSGLTIVGVHTPEFPFERDAGNVGDAIDQNGLRYPVAQETTTPPGTPTATSTGRRST